MTSTTTTTTTTTAELSALSCTNDEDLRVPFYCEENIWRLCYKRQERQRRQGQGVQPQHNVNANPDQDFVLFISNAQKCCPIFHQKATASSSRRNQPCFWDYHVILLSIHCSKTTNSIATYRTTASHTQTPPQKPQTQQQQQLLLQRQAWIYDFDSTLPFPCPFQQYIQESFSYSFPLHLQPLFRIVSANSYLQHFYSNRMHMYDTITQAWLQTPPLYTCIMNGYNSTSSEYSTSSSHSSNVFQGSNLHLYHTMQDQHTMQHQTIINQKLSLLDDSMYGLVVDLATLYTTWV